MTGTYWQRGETIDYINTGTEKITAGTLIVIGKKVGIAGCDILPKAAGSLHVTGVFIFPKKDASTVINQGDMLYYDGSGIVTTETSTTPVGWAVEASPAGTETVKIKIA